MLKLIKQKKLRPKLEEQVNQTGFLIEFFSGMKKGDFYEELVEGEYPDWQLQFALSVNNQGDNFV